MTTQPITLGGGTQVDEPVSSAIIEAVAERAGVDPIALPPLYERVDPDALDALFASTSKGSLRVGTIEFDYYGYEITVVCDGETTVTLTE